jgi:hypothetical protein
MELSIIALIFFLIAAYLFKSRKSGAAARKDESDYEKDKFISDKNNHKNHRSHIDMVTEANFYKKKIMNKSEFRVFKIIEKMMAEKGGGYRVFSQTCLGQIIGSSDEAAFRAVNSKRIDFVIVEPFGNIAVAVEYQGGGHYQNNAVERDAIKREALRKAGTPFVEVQENDSEEWIRLKITQALGGSMSNAASA